MQKVLILNKVPVDNLTAKKFKRIILEWSRQRQKRVVLYLNTNGLINYIENSEFSKIFKLADIIHADGWGPIYASRLSKTRLPERVNVTDVIDDLLEKFNIQKTRIYLLGCKHKEVKKTANTINKRYPGITICGYHGGFFPKRYEPKIVKAIANSNPDLVLIGMGTKFGASISYQELFISKNFKKLPNAVYWAVGGLFYYISGQKLRAPKWMRTNGLEWLFRFFQEPKRLWRRYTITNLKFAYYTIGFLIKHSLFLKS